MSANTWLATGNFNTSYQQEQKTFVTSLDRSIFTLFLVILFAWPVFFELGNKEMFVIVNILFSIVAVMGLNLVLLGVVGSAIFMFTQYLRQQPAQDAYDAWLDVEGNRAAHSTWELFPEDKLEVAGLYFVEGRPLLGLLCQTDARDRDQRHPEQASH